MTFLAVPRTRSDDKSSCLMVMRSLNATVHFPSLGIRAANERVAGVEDVH